MKIKKSHISLIYVLLVIACFSAGLIIPSYLLPVVFVLQVVFLVLGLRSMAQEIDEALITTRRELEKE